MEAQIQNNKKFYLDENKSPEDPAILHDDDVGEEMTEQAYQTLVRLLEEAEFVPKRFLPSTTPVSVFTFPYEALA